jgi:hypothetical protein
MSGCFFCLYFQFDKLLQKEFRLFFKTRAAFLHLAVSIEVEPKK